MCKKMSRKTMIFMTAKLESLEAQMQVTRNKEGEVDEKKLRANAKEEYFQQMIQGKND